MCLRTIRQRFPKLEIETCSGGGGRVDLGVMRLTDEAWTSDNTDPFDRLLIQDGFTYAYTPEVMMAWVTDSPNWYNGRSTSLTYRFLSAMQGSLGIGANLDKWTPEDFANARYLTGVYKEIRSVVQQGMLYRLVSPRDGSNVSATESVSLDRKTAVVFGFLHSQQMGYAFPTIFPRGLDENAVYSIEAIGGKMTDGTPKQASGAYWMNHGIGFPLKGDFAAEGALLKSEP